jgi:hypothetical protein
MIPTGPNRLRVAAADEPENVQPLLLHSMAVCGPLVDHHPDALRVLLELNRVPAASAAVRAAIQEVRCGLPGWATGVCLSSAEVRGGLPGWATGVCLSSAEACLEGTLGKKIDMLFPHVLDLQ